MEAMFDPPALAIAIGLAKESRKTIEFIKLYKNDQPRVNVEKTVRANEVHEEQFTPPL